MNLLRAHVMRVRSNQSLFAIVAGVLFMSAALMITSESRFSPDVHHRVLFDVALLASVYGAIRYVTDYHSGVVARMVLLSHRNTYLWTKTLVIALEGALVGAAATVAVSIATFDVALLWGPPIGAAGAVWGLFVGVVVRSWVLAFTLVAGVHMGALGGTEQWPLLSGVGLVVQLACLVASGTAAWVVMTSRDVT